MDNPVMISRVTLRNYKSIARCSIDLHSLVFLVGPNGAGKSNFLDALRLIAESLNTRREKQAAVQRIVPNRTRSVGAIGTDSDHATSAGGDRALRTP